MLNFNEADKPSTDIIPWRFLNAKSICSTDVHNPSFGWKLTRQVVAADVKDAEPDEGQLGQEDFDFKSFLPNRIEGVPRNHLCLELVTIARNSQYLKDGKLGFLLIDLH